MYKNYRKFKIKNIQIYYIYKKTKMYENIKIHKYGNIKKYIQKNMNVKDIKEDV